MKMVAPDTISNDYSAISPKYQSIDNDNDGIDDRWDQCLDESENYNGFVDTDGCPDVIGAESTNCSNH